MAEAVGARRCAPAAGARTLLRAFALAAALPLVAPGPALAQRLPFTLFTADDGLAGTQIWDLEIDRRGYLWVATTWGLCRYDGERFTTFSVTEGLPSPNVRSILEDNAGRLWIGTNHGIAVYDGKRIEPLADLGGLEPSAVWASAIDARGRLWFGTEFGLIGNDGRRVRAFRRADGLADDYVYSLLAARDGALWVGSRGAGVARCLPTAAGELGPCRVFAAADGLVSGEIRALAEGADGRIYVGMRGAGVAVWDGERFERRGSLGGRGAIDTYALAINARGELLIGSSDRGLAVCRLPGLDLCLGWGEENGLPHEAVRALASDAAGTLWIGTEAGLARLAREDLWSYGVAEGLPDPHVYALAADPAGGIWTGTVRGLAHLETGAHGRAATRSWRDGDGPPGGWVWALAALPDGRLWVGGERGFCRFDPALGRCEAPYAEPLLPRQQTFDLHVDSLGALWAATPSGVARLDSAAAPGRGRLELFHPADGLAAEPAYDFAEDAEGRLWIAHGAGLSWRDAAGFHRTGPDSGLPLASVRVLGIGKSGTLWVGGYGHVSRRVGFDQRGPRFERLGVALGEEELLVLTLAEDEHGHLLLGTNRGVVLFKPRGRGGRGEVIARFDRKVGTIGTEVAHSAAYAADPRGRHWFGFKGGLTVFPASFEALPARPPTVAFERLESSRGQIWRAPFSWVELGGRARWLDAERVALAPKDRGVRVTARALDLRRDMGIRFQFQLSGFEEGWSEPQREPFRAYTNLDPRDYVLRARAALGDGPWGPAAELGFTIRPAFWQTGLFRAASAVSLVALGVLAVLGRTRRIAARARDLEREVAGRTDDLARYARALAEHLAALDRGTARMREADRHRSEVLAKLSHEVRTPLTSILGFSELLESSASSRLTARELRFLGNVRESGNHLLRLVNNLLDQAKLEAGRMEVQLEPVALQEVLVSLVSLVEGFALTRDVRLEIETAPELPVVEVDVAKLRQVLLNLLSNAIKFSPAGGVVTLAARALGGGESPLGEPAYEIEVRDRGPGIRAEDLATIFEPFRQVGEAHARRPGTGLGLPIARQLLRLMGGRIDVETAPGEGARFRVLLPVRPRAVEALEGERPGDESADRPRVLIVEADRQAFAELAANLESGGFLAVRAPDVEEARRMVPELRPAAVALRLDPARPEGWRRAAALERELGRTGAPLALVARAGMRATGWALAFDRILSGDADAEELTRALASVAPDGAGEARRAVLLLGGAPAALTVRSRALSNAGFEAVAPVDGESLRAAFARDDLAAVVVDPESQLFGGLRGARAAQSADPELPWILLVPAQLAAPARRLYAEEVDAASELAGTALEEAISGAFRRAQRARGDR
jgi:signal transduction histidine kinase/ligand-binding sensor domain-containing protein/DNA-binding response OmpR family regulator